MKKIIIVLLFAFSLPIFAQTHILVKHNGDKIAVNYIKTNNNLIYYTIGDSQEEHSIAAFAVAELINKSTNVITKVTDKIIVNGGQDYRKVVLIDANQTKGLIATPKELKFNNNVKGQSPLVVKNHNVLVLKKKAAKEGIPFVLLTENNRADSSGRMYTY